MLFSCDPDKTSADWEQEDLVRMAPVNTRIHVQSLNGLPLIIPEGNEKKIYMGIELFQRPISFREGDMETAEIVRVRHLRIRNLRGNGWMGQGYITMEPGTMIRGLGGL